jgi:hypothetical protein
MRVLYFAAAFLVMGTLAAFAARSFFRPGGSEFLSGPQVGSKVPGVFEALNINGKDAGEEACLYCRYGSAPVVMIFASKPTETLTTLLQPIEKGAAESAKAREVGACLVITQRNKEIRDSLGKLADKENYKQIVLGMIEPGGLKKYQLHADAEVTVLFYSNQVVRVNHAYKAGEFTEQVAREVGKEAADFLSAK